MKLEDNTTSFKENLLLKICNGIFYFAYFLIISDTMLSQVIIFARYVRYADRIGYLLLMISFLLFVYKRNIKVILVQLLILAILLVSSYVSNERDLLIVFLLIIAFHGMDLRTLIKYDLALKILFVIIVVTLYFLNLTDSYYMIRENGQIRSSMGFVHPNTFGAYLLSIAFGIYYLNFKRIGILYYILFIIIAFIIRYFADSRTSIYALFLICFLHIIYKMTSGKLFEKKLIRFFLINSFLILTLGSLLLEYLYKIGNPLVRILDKLFHERISLIIYFTDNYNINLFGNEIPLVLTRELEFTGMRYLNYLDNGFILLLLRFGLLSFIIATIFFNKAIKNLLETKAYDLVIIFSIFLVTGLLESHFYNIIFNTYLLSFSQVISKQEIVNVNK